MASIESQLKAAARRYEGSREARDELIRQAAGQGLSRRKIGQIVGLSHQRVDQIVRKSRV